MKILKKTFSDLKPENVFLDREGHIRLVNFDLAQRIGSQTSLASTRHMLDSPAPEVIKGDNSGMMIDYWEFVKSFSRFSLISNSRAVLSMNYYQVKNHTKVQMIQLNKLKNMF